MKRALIKLMLGALLLGVVSAQTDNPVQQVLLNPLTVTEIPVGMTGPTTIRFPSAISDLEGSFISSDPTSSALFLLSFRPGSSFFSIRALAAETNTTLNVVWKDQTYVLELIQSKEPWLSVIFTPSVSSVSSATKPSRAVSPSRLLGMLDTAKAYPLLKNQHAPAVAGVDYVRTNILNDFDDHNIKTEEVFHFKDVDMAVFRIVVSNKTDRVMRYLPQSLMVQTGKHVFYQAISDAKGEIPAHGSVPVYFAITGITEGGRNLVPLGDDFLVFLQRLDRPVASVFSPSFSPPSSPRINSSRPVEHAAVTPVGISLFDDPPEESKKKTSPTPAQSATPATRSNAEVKPTSLFGVNLSTSQTRCQCVTPSDVTPFTDQPKSPPVRYYYYDTTPHCYCAPAPRVYYSSPGIVFYVRHSRACGY